MNSETRFKYLDEGNIFREKEGILNGIQGIGLAIISAINPNITQWD